MATSFTPPPPRRPEAVEVPGAPVDDGPPWAGWMGLAALLTALFATTVLGAVAVGIMSAAGVDTSDTGKGGVAIALTYLQDLTFIATVLALSRIAIRPPRAADLGICVPAVRPTVRWVAIAVVGYAIFTVVFATVVHPKNNENLFHSLGIQRNAAGAVAALAILVCVLAPIAEELLFRGFMFAAMIRWGGPWVASVLVGLLFGAIHAFGTPAILLIQLAALGFFFCLVRWKTGSILPTIALHAINNALAFSSLESWTWQAAPLVVGSATLAVALVTPFARPGWRTRRSLA